MRMDPKRERRMIEWAAHLILRPHDRWPEDRAIGQALAMYGPIRSGQLSLDLARIALRVHAAVDTHRRHKAEPAVRRPQSALPDLPMLEVEDPPRPAHPAFLTGAPNRHSPRQQIAPRPNRHPAIVGATIVRRSEIPNAPPAPPTTPLDIEDVPMPADWAALAPPPSPAATPADLARLARILNAERL